MSKALRFRRLAHNGSGRHFIVPLDHGLTMGPLPGLSDLETALHDLACSDDVDAVVVHKGLVPACAERFAGRDVALIVHLSASTALGPDPDDKALVGSVEEGLRSGADAVSVHVNLGARTEARMLADLGRISASCDAWGVPLLAMMYLRGSPSAERTALGALAHAARVAQELGADLVKLACPEPAEAFRTVTRAVQIPVVIAGGPSGAAPQELLSRVEASLAAGGAGICFGRNVFQSGEPRRLCRAIGRVLHEGWSAAAATAELAGSAPPTAAAPCAAAEVRAASPVRSVGR